MIRPEQAQLLSLQQAAETPLPAGSNEISAKVEEIVFLGDSLTCSVITASGSRLCLKALSVAATTHQPGSDVRVRWHAAHTCVYHDWNESDLAKGAGSH
ncbi:TPA: TOBE domain-containing protein [Pseudomonas aeruginosa]